MIAIYTDGSCRGNGKANNSGGYGFVVIEYDSNPENGIVIDAYQLNALEDTTNNREEIKAILHVLKKYGKHDNGEWTNDIPIVYSDSAYCVNTFTNWMYGWERNNWIKSDKKVPENLDLIKDYYETEKEVKIDLRKISGHNGHLWNELADGLATGKITVKEVLKKYGRDSENSDSSRSRAVLPGLLFECNN